MMNDEQTRDRNSQTAKEAADVKAQKPGQSAWWLPALRMFARLSVWIAVPIILALYIGSWLDRKYNSEPWLLLVSIGLSFIVSTIGLVKNTLKEFRKIEAENSKQSAQGARLSVGQGSASGGTAENRKQ